MSSPIQLDELVSRMADGDREAFAMFYDRTSPFIFGLVLKIIGDRDEAEDVTQEVYLQMWRTAGSFDPTRGTVRTWIAMAARSRAIDRMRSSGSYGAALEGLASHSQDHQAGGEPPSDPEESVSLRERRELVRGALADLSEEQRQALEIAFFRGWSHREISEKTGTPLGTVKSRIRAGLTRLEARLGPVLGPDR